MTGRRSSVIIGACVVIALVVLPVGIATAYWTGTGSGASSGESGDAAPVSLSPGTPSATLYPGGTSSVVLTATNPNDFPVRIDTLSRDATSGTGGFAVDAGHSSCGVAALTFTTQTNGGNGWTIPARVGAVDGELAVTLPAALAMSTSAAGACQGATFTVYLVAG